MTPIIRQLEIQEAVQGLHFLSSYAFTPTPPLPDFEPYSERIHNRKGSKYFGVFADDSLQAITCTTTPLIQNLRGCLFKMGGIANVATHPAARRKGYARELLRHQFKDFHEDGITTSCLYPFKEAFYEHLGYVTLPQTKRISFTPGCLDPILNMNLEIGFELVSFYDGYEKFRAYCQRQQERTHGMALFTIPQKEAAKGHQAWLLFAKLNEEIIGAMNYTLRDQIMNQTLLAYDFLFDNAIGKFALLNWIARHIDQAGKVILTLKPELFGENFYTDLRPEYQGVFVPPMARIISLTLLQGLPCGKGEIAIQLSDAECQWNNGTWRLSAENGELQIERVAKAECELTIHGLTALVYGIADPLELVLRGWGNPDANQQMILRKLFPPAIPYLHAMY